MKIELIRFTSFLHTECFWKKILNLNKNVFPNPKYNKGPTNRPFLKGSHIMFNTKPNHQQ